MNCGECGNHGGSVMVLCGLGSIVEIVCVEEVRVLCRNGMYSRLRLNLLR